MSKSAIILAGGLSTRFGKDKGLLLLANKPLIKYVLDVIKSLVDERLVIVSSESQAKNYLETVVSDVKVFVDRQDTRGPLVGALTGFEEAQGESSLLVPCDTPFVSREVVTLLFELCAGKTAVIPRWPNSCIEPLQAVYHTKSALDAAREAVGKCELNMQGMTTRLRGVRYVSTLVLQQLDPDLRTFLNVNSALDLRKAEAMLKRSAVFRMR